jgi:hypothetical protein
MLRSLLLEFFNRCHEEGIATSTMKSCEFERDCARPIPNGLRLKPSSLNWSVSPRCSQAPRSRRRTQARSPLSLQPRPQPKRCRCFAACSQAAGRVPNSLGEPEDRQGRLRSIAVTTPHPSTIERLATFLTDLLGDGEGSQIVRLLLSRQEIADYLGLVVEPVSRSFFALKQRGVIARAGRTSVTVLDCSALRSIAAGGGERID